MRESIDFTSWIAGWTALAFVVAYGIFLIRRSSQVAKAHDAVPTRILVTGSRGKSGTVRLIHEILRRSGQSAYGKVTGTIAVELYPDGSEHETVRLGAASVNEMPEAMMRSASLGASVGVFECMAVSPDLITMVSNSHIRPQIVVIPTIRLDHLEEEGLDEETIGRSIIDSVGECDYLVVGIDQPDILDYAEEVCKERGITLVIASPSSTQPVIPGHHPTNIAVAVEVAALAGVEKKKALKFAVASSVEPRALTVMTYATKKKKHVEMIDLGGANDPQSAYEALDALSALRYPVVPIIVNRWERPLRSLVFMSAVMSRFPVVGVSGTLGFLTQQFHSLVPDHTAKPHRESVVFRLTRKRASDLEALAGTIFPLTKKGATGISVIIMENTHEPTIDLLRTTFATQGVEKPLVVKGQK